MRARYYNPEIKRFINVAPIEDGTNWYAYANGDPISLVDPFGLAPSLSWKWLGHAVLDVLGMVPGIGVIADLANAAWYLAEGDYFGAITSGISAIPGIGDAIGTGMKAFSTSCKVTKAADMVISASKTIGNVGGWRWRVMSRRMSCQTPIRR